MKTRFTKFTLTIFTFITLLIITYIILSDNDSDWKTDQTHYYLSITKTDSTYLYQINFWSTIYLNGDTNTIPGIADGYLSAVQHKDLKIWGFDSSIVVFENQKLHLIDSGKTSVYVEYPNRIDTLLIKVIKKDNVLLTEEKSYF